MVVLPQYGEGKRPEGRHRVPQVEPEFAPGKLHQPLELAVFRLR